MKYIQILLHRLKSLKTEVNFCIIYSNPIQSAISAEKLRIDSCSIVPFEHNSDNLEFQDVWFVNRRKFDIFLTNKIVSYSTKIKHNLKDILRMHRLGINWVLVPALKLMNSMSLDATQLLFHLFFRVTNEGD